jgi:hypothetical protein
MKYIEISYKNVKHAVKAVEEIKALSLKYYDVGNIIPKKKKFFIPIRKKRNVFVPMRLTYFDVEFSDRRKINDLSNYKKGLYIFID